MKDTFKKLKLKKDSQLILINQDDDNFKNMNALQKGGAQRMEKAVSEGVERNMINDSHFRGKVLDFGCGVGGSSYFFSLNQANVVAVELSNSIDELKKLDILPKENIIHGDGLKLMRSFDENSFDMVVAQMLGPDSEGDFIEVFYKEANRILKQSGRILITSDIGTIQQLNARYINGYQYKGPRHDLFISYKHNDVDSLLQQKFYRNTSKFK